MVWKVVVLNAAINNISMLHAHVYEHFLPLPLCRLQRSRWLTSAPLASCGASVAARTSTPTSPGPTTAAAGGERKVLSSVHECFLLCCALLKGVMSFVIQGYVSQRCCGGPRRCDRCFLRCGSGLLLRAYYLIPCIFLLLYRCNICGMQNDVPSTYFSHLDNNGQRRDRDQRPELARCSVEFVAPADYMVSGCV